MKKESSYQQDLLIQSLHYQIENPKDLARVASAQRNRYQLWTIDGEVSGFLTGKYQFDATDQTSYPTVGDYVRITRTDEQAQIRQLQPRSSAFIRKAAGTSHDVQIVAANIDVIFICMALNNDFNVRRLERYLTVAWDSGAVPVVVLTKSDLADRIVEHIQEVEAVAPGCEIILTDSTSDEGLVSIQAFLQEGKTYALIGSSGVGKTTLVNHLIGDTVGATKGLRNDDKGRHTTTNRMMYVLPNGAFLIDTPGMREMGIESGDFAKGFQDIEEIASQCRFNDCSHETEPGCAIQAALANGELSQDRYQNYLRLKKEANYEGMNAKQIEKKKVQSMFASVGGKKGRKNIKKQSKKW